jgi:hypothetical protein
MGAIGAGNDTGRRKNAVARRFIQKWKRLRKKDKESVHVNNVSRTHR